MRYFIIIFKCKVCPIERPILQLPAIALCVVSQTLNRKIKILIPKCKLASFELMKTVFLILILVVLLEGDAQ